MKDSIKNHKQWQDNQYNPGKFTGGNIPGWMVGNRRFKRFVLVCIGIMVVIQVVYIFAASGL
jgi:hypothetical protein